MLTSSSYSDEVSRSLRLFSVIVTCLAATSVEDMSARLKETIKTADAKTPEQLGRIVRTFIMTIADDIYFSSGMTTRTIEAAIWGMKETGVVGGLLDSHN